MLGRSRATFSVVKQGGTTDLAGQAALCRHLGPRVAPRVLADLPDGYAMELLELSRPTTRSQVLQQLMDVRALLEREVWGRPALNHPSGWLARVCLWLQEAARTPRAEEMGRLLRELYPTGEGEPCLIHGDPTLANVMWRERQLVLIDPVPCRANVPSLREMDVARLLQSAFGWERALDPTFPPASPYGAGLQAVVGGLDPLMVDRSMLWAAYNCERIIYRAADRLSTTWAEQAVEAFLTMVRARRAWSQ